MRKNPLLRVILLASLLCNIILPVYGKPNVVFMFADDLGYGDLACYGHPYAQTPNLDKLADEGTMFKRFYVTGNWCNPSRVGFLTSRHHSTMPNWADQHGYVWRQTVTELFKNAGYATGHFGKWHLGENWKDANGDLPAGGIYGMDEIQALGKHGDVPQGRDHVMYDAAEDFIERHKDVPFYVNVMGFITHYPVAPSPQLAAHFNDVTVDRSLFGEQLTWNFDECERLGGNIDEGMRNYLGDVYGLDLCVGRLLQKLDDLGLKDNTIVIFSADNGPAPVGKTIMDQYPGAHLNMLGWAGDLRGQKHVDYEGGVRQPFIVRWPGKVPAGVVNETSLISALDYLPTLCAVAEVPYDPEWFEGENISDIWFGNKRSRKNPIFQNNNNWSKPSSILQGNWRLYLNPNNSIELYDLGSEEHEYNNVADQNPDIVSALRTQLDLWNDTRPDNYCRNNCELLPDPEKKPVVIGPATDLPVDLDTGTYVHIGPKVFRAPLGMRLTSSRQGKMITVSLPVMPAGDEAEWAVSELILFNAAGRVMMQRRVERLPYTFNAAGLPPGEYQARLWSGKDIIRGTFQLL